MNLPKRLISKSFEDYIPTCQEALAVKKLVQQYSEDFDMNSQYGTCLVFLGTPGTGKTHLAVSLLMELFKAGYKCRYEVAAGVCDRIKATYSSRNHQDKVDSINFFCAPHLLVIDEIGAQHGTQAEMKILDEVITARYNNALPTIVISNLDDLAICDYIGERAFDRLMENSGVILTFNWESERLK